MNTLELESSIHYLDRYVGKKIQIIAFGISYLGVLKKVDYDRGFLVLVEGPDKVTLDLDRVESFGMV